MRSACSESAPRTGCDMDFVQVDVFADRAFEGNPLAVFPQAAALTGTQMQSIAREMNLSETSFVTASSQDSYDVRIFTPQEELRFAGHPTIGTAWVLSDLGLVEGELLTQRSRVGDTEVTLKGEDIWFERKGTSDEDLQGRDPDVDARMARSLGLETAAIGLEARELGRPGRLLPAFADAALRFLIVPLRDVDALASCRPHPTALAELADFGAYCFTAVAAGRLRARGFFPSVGVEEDPATGSACASLGVYLAHRLGAIRLEVNQGVEIRRPSRLLMEAERGRVRVGGRCHLVMTGRMERIP